VNQKTKTYDYEKLMKATKELVRNLNQVIDRNYYPISEGKTSNMKHRPIGVGIQGLANVFALLRLPFESKEAQQLNKNIFESIYFAACTESMELAKRDGPYSSFPGSPASKGNLQFDMWQVIPSERHDWKSLKENIVKHGLRNSTLIALVPTASTSQIMCNNESFEPFTTNLYVRKTGSGEFIIINPYLLADLCKMGKWNKRMKTQLIKDNGSVQNLPIPDELKELYKTVFEMSGKTLLDMSLARAPFIDQTQSFNCYMSDPNYSKLSSYHFYAWKQGAKTSMYYQKQPSKVDADKQTISCDSCSA
jgi:ribonucleoside-diphosphate reductase alpha chain